MKKIAMITLAALALAGCNSVSVQKNEDGSWSVSKWSHWMAQDVDAVEAEVDANGKIKFKMNGYKSDASDQFAEMFKQTYAGLAVLGRLAGTVFNPAVAGVPLTAEGADAEAIAKIQQSLANAKAEATKAKAEATKAKAELKQAQAELEKAKQTQTESLPECEGDECVYETEE